MNDTLIVTHHDLDGIVSAIVLCKIFPKSDIISGTYKNINTKFENALAKQEYKKIFITDISIDEIRFNEFILNNKKKLHIIDHHPREADSIISNQYIKIGKDAACMMTKKYVQQKFEKKFNRVWNDKLETLVMLADDYDTWRHIYPMSKYLNRLFYYHNFNKFLERYKNGIVELSSIEKNFLKKNNAHLKNILTNLSFSKVTENVIVTYSSEGNIDEIADYLLTSHEEVATVFVYNTKSRGLSIRGDYKPIHFGEFARRFGGGGHKDAAGVVVKNHDELQNVVEEFVKEQNIVEQRI